MKRLESKVLLSLVIHVVWGLLIFFSMIQVESGTTKFIYRFIMLNKYSKISKPIVMVIVYILEYIVYRIKPLEHKADKIIFWIVTVLMTGLIMFPMM